MKNVELDEIKSYDFNDKLLLVIDSRWKNYFQSEPIFQVVINDNKIMLIGPKVSTQDPTTNNNRTNQSEVDSIE